MFWVEKVVVGEYLLKTGERCRESLFTKSSTIHVQSINYDSFLIRYRPWLRQVPGLTERDLELSGMETIWLLRGLCLAGGDVSESKVHSHCRNLQTIFLPAFFHLSYPSFIVTGVPHKYWTWQSKFIELTDDFQLKSSTNWCNYGISQVK